jgi:TctA family transporter
MPLGSSGDLKRLQLTIKFIAAQFKALVGIIAIYIFADVLNKAILSVFPRDYFMGIVKSIITPYRIVMIPLKDLLL